MMDRQKINDMNCWISSQDGEFNNFVATDVPHKYGPWKMRQVDF